ncbi:hypothetical protein BJ165DRAFT_651769 [Panaeolus papilionaceus]|nr:hypothetical protein BJ165DRAFT_651769 [Panaeolus papilionaceus]
MSEPSRLLITGGYTTFITNNIQGQGLGVQQLRNAVLNEAMSLSHLPPACCPGTRLDILRRLLRWINRREGTAKTLWLIGGAASGKSALAQSIIQWCAHNSVPQGAIVFLFPSQPQAPENVWRYLIPTIACQIAAYIPAYLQELQGISQNILRGIVNITIEQQIQLLISAPLSAILSSNPPPVLPRLIVIDGLNEVNCSSQYDSIEAHKDVILMLLDLAQKPWFPFQLLITSRHPSWLPFNFRSISLASVFPSNVPDIKSLECFDARPDIRTYFEAMFRSIKEADGPQTFAPRGEHDWERIYDILVTRTGGHFGHAASIHHFMHTNAITSLPEQRLQSLLNEPSSGNSRAALEANLFQQVDALFSSILKAATQQSTVDNAILLFAYSILPHSPRRGNRRLIVSEIEQFHNVRCKSLLPGLHPIIKVVEGRVELPYPCIAEYLLDRGRSGDFHLEPTAQYTLMAKSALAHISCSLVDANGQPSIKDNVYALACESLKGLIHHASLSALSGAFEAIRFAHIQRCRIQGLDALCAFDTILT